MFRKFCSSAVYSSVPHVLILTALTCGYNQQVITCKVCSFSQEQRDCILDFPFPYPRTRLIQTIPHPMVQRAKLVQWVFEGWALRKGDGSKWIKPCIPIIHFFWETKKPLLFTVIIVFFWQAFEGNGCKYLNGTQEGEGRRPFTHLYSSHLSPFSLTFTLPLQMPATQISVIWEYMCFEYLIPVLKSLLLIRKPKH